MRARGVTTNESLIASIPKSSVVEIQELRNEMLTYKGNIFFPTYNSKLSQLSQTIKKRLNPGYADAFQKAFENGYVAEHNPYESPLLAIIKTQERIEKGWKAVEFYTERSKTMLKNIKSLLDPIFDDKTLNVWKELRKFPGFYGPGYGANTRHYTPGYTVPGTYVPGHYRGGSYVPGRHVAGRPGHYVPGHSEPSWKHVDVVEIENLGYNGDDATGFIAWSIRRICNFQERDLIKQVLPLLRDMRDRTKYPLREWFEREINNILNHRWCSNL